MLGFKDVACENWVVLIKLC